MWARIRQEVECIQKIYIDDEDQSLIVPILHNLRNLISKLDPQDETINDPIIPAAAKKAKHLEGKNLLHIIVYVCDIALLKKILTHPKINVDAKSSKGETALFIAVYAKYHSQIQAELMTKALIDANANPNIANQRGRTPLHLAATSTLTLTESLLALPNCDVNLQDDAGDTPMHLVMAKKIEDHNKIIATFINHKADLTLKNKDNLTALEVALCLDIDSGVNVLTSMNLDREAVMITLLSAVKCKSKQFALALCQSTLAERVELFTEVHPRITEVINIAAESGFISLLKYIHEKNPAALAHSTLAQQLITNDNQDIIESIASCMNTNSLGLPRLDIESVEMILTVNKQKLLDRGYQVACIVGLSMFDDYLQNISSRSAITVNHLFAVRDNYCHWLSGRINFHNEKTSIYIEETLGSSQLNEEGLIDILECISINLPDVDIYMNGLIIQKSELGCGVMAAHNLLELSTIDKYLPAKTIHFFDYCKNNVLESRIITGTDVTFTVQIITPPIKSLRRMQNLNSPNGFFSTLAQSSKETAELVINKRNQTAKQSIEANCENGKNKFTENKLTIFRHQVIAYLSTHSLQEIRSNLHFLAANTHPPHPPLSKKTISETTPETAIIEPPTKKFKFSN